MKGNIYLYILVMAAVTYLIRMLPLTLIRKEIKNPFLRSFLHYVPYATILYSTASPVSAALGFLGAAVLAYLGKSLVCVAGCACVIVYAAELIL